MKGLLDWLDDRTGYRKLAKEALFEHIPGGARWRYVWGSTLTFALFIQFVTGAILWMAYNPSSQTAWESVYYIQHQMAGGWFLRGVHHYTAQIMTVLLVLHLMQVLIDGAYKAPREVNFWTGLILLKLVLALSLTGYLLPWDQKGYWATKVATNILAIVPLIGPALQKIAIGGSDYGHHTLSRFFALHAGILPAMVVALIAGHIYLFRKHGITAKQPYKKPDAKFWPDQVLMDTVACLAVLLTVLVLCLRHHGAPLSAPAEPSEPFGAARPDWYFLFLFQFLKLSFLTEWFGHHGELIGAIIIPGVLMGVLFAMPFIGRWRLGHRFNLAYTVILLAGAGWLTWQALEQDRNSPDYQRAVAQADRNAQRVIELASGPQGIPLTGAADLLRNDPLTQGPRLFAKNCASCHHFGGHDGQGEPVKDPPSAPDLKGFASREWIAGMLDPAQITAPHYYGGTKFKEGKMVRFVQRTVAKYDDEERAALADAIVALSAEAALPAQQALDQREAARLAAGRKAITDTLSCLDCHTFHNEDEDASAPDLTGYGSETWLMGMISDPTHTRFYGSRNDRMPEFGKDERLSEREIRLLARWLRGDWHRGGVPAGSGE